jgi:WD40 repeat protein
VFSVAFSPDGTRVATGSHDHMAKMWDARTGTPLLDLKGHTLPSIVAFSPDGTRIVTVSRSIAGGWAYLRGYEKRPGELKVWDARTGTPLLELKGLTGPVSSVAFSPDGTRIVAGSVYQQTVQVWDAQTGTPQLDLKGHPVTSLAFSPDGTRLLTGSQDGTAQVWDAQTGTPLLELKEHTVEVSSVAFNSDGTRIVTGSHDQRALVWDAWTGTRLLELKGHTRPLSSVAFSPDDTRIVAGSWDGTTKLWDARTGTLLLELGRTGSVYSVAFSPDGTRIVTGGYDRTAKVWDARPGTPPLELKGHTVLVSSVAFSPDGTRIVSGSQDNTAKVWDARTGTPLLTLKGHTVPVMSVAFSPDGMWIVTGGGRDPSKPGEAKVWNARTGALLSELKGHMGAVPSVAFSPDGTRIVTVSQDIKREPRAPWEWTQTAKVWDARTGQELKGEPIPQTIAKNCISPDGRLFAHPVGDRVELIPLQQTEEELSYRLLHTQPNFGRYRESYEAARAAQDDFAAGFYLKLLPLPEQEILKAQAAADREIAAGQTQGALVHLVTLSKAKPDDTPLFQKLAALQAWFGQDKELADTCRRGLAWAKNTTVPETADRVAKACCLLPSTEKPQLEAALALARKAVQLGKDSQYLPYFQMALGMAEYRSGHFAEADAALLAAAKGAPNNPHGATTSALYRAMSLFRQGKEDEARKLATAAAAKMKPLPKDEKNPLAGGASPDDLILWLAYKEAKAMIQFDAAPAEQPQEKK